MKRLALLLFVLLIPNAHAEETTKSVVECMRTRVPPFLTIGQLELTTYDRVGGSRTLQGRLYSSKENGGPQGAMMHATLRVDAPAEFKGAAYLVRETDDYLRDGMFVYLPGVKRVRRVTGTFADASLLGTNFSYFDFKQLQNAFVDLLAESLVTEQVNGRPAYVLTARAVPGTETRYTMAKVWVDQQACVAVRAEFWDNKKVSKELSSPAGSLRKSGELWYVSEIEMRDASSGTRTVLKTGKLDAAKPPASRYFDPNTFHLGP
ncbi:MAG TPA: outer membrane lipoprotein-sorting protein [Verrucomicrobiae bacterium]|nr:outer membrane lipoprotein-sorting protein [Verrucomicrobiae bacterium]